MLLHDGGHHARDADAVAAHEEGLLNSVLVHEGGAHGLGVLGAELEDLGDLDAAGVVHGLAALGAEVALLGGDHIDPLGDGEVAAHLGVAVVVVGQVGANEPPLGVAQGLVGADADALRQAHGPDEALDQAGLAELLIGHHVVLAEGVLGLAVVHLMVAGNEDDGRTTLAVDERQRLARGGLLHAEKRGEVGDGAGVGRVDALELAGLALGDGDPGRGGLGVGGKAAVAPNELGLACVSQGHKLDGGVSADLAGVGDDGQGLHAAALCDAGVGGLLVVIALLQGLLRGGEGIGVLHDELASAHETEARAPLVAELVLDLVERDG